MSNDVPLGRLIRQVRCNKCGWETYASMNDPLEQMAHLGDMCPQCGHQSNWLTRRGDFSIVKYLEVSRAVWYKPWTWFSVELLPMARNDNRMDQDHD